ncbi:MAG: D-2-hydroxyacid dehydrogenase [Verrucomicrobia bacterium]|nr:D-2-hydroxyacid dehydrogenase [Verrucomicrobiota bacterium]
MNLVILDGYAANPCDLSWDAFLAMADCRVYDRTPPEEVVARALDADLVLTNKTVLSADVIGKLPKLRYIGVLATGYNVVDVAAAQARGIRVTNIPGYGTASVAQHTLALILELTNQVGHHAQGVREGRWTNSKDFAYWDATLIELQNLTLGIIGYGSIGRKVAELARAFGMKILAPARPGSKSGENVTFVPLDQLLQDSDIVTLHCPLTEETRNLICAKSLARMKPSAFLINTSRGPLIDEEALAAAFRQNQIAGAALDVLSAEPPAADNPLLSAPRCLITPHQAWATLSARKRLLDTAAGNVRAFLEGRTENAVC